MYVLYCILVIFERDTAEDGQSKWKLGIYFAALDLRPALIGVEW